MDDGASSVEVSIEMLDQMSAQGVKKVVASPHFYPTEEYPDSFLTRRANAFESITPHLKPNHPEIFLGAEVAYFRGISKSQELDLLTIGETSLILIEMPFMKWPDFVVDEILAIKKIRGLVPVIAHIERYGKQSPQHIGALLENGVLIQSNAEAFLDFFERKRSLDRLKSGVVTLLGSDCHNLSGRKPNLGDAVSVIEKKLGHGFLKEMLDYTYTILK